MVDCLSQSKRQDLKGLDGMRGWQGVWLVRRGKSCCESVEGVESVVREREQEESINVHEHAKEQR